MKTIMNIRNMKRIILVLFIAIPLLTSKAQVVRWVMPPVYDKIHIAEDTPLIVGDSANATSINTLEGRRIDVTYHQMHPFVEGFSVATDHVSDAIAGFYNSKGEFVRLSGYTVAYDYPFFSDGSLLVKKGDKYYLINTAGEEASCSRFAEVYPFNNGRALCMAYESMEKKKNPYYCYIMPNGKSGYGRVSLAYNGKEVDNLDVKFLSSLNDDGVGIAVVKNKIYKVGKESPVLRPALPTRNETNVKKQLSVVWDYSGPKNNGTFLLRGKSGKASFVEYYFDELMRLVKVCYADGEEKIYEEKSLKPIEYPTSLSAQRINGKWNLQSSDKEILPPQFDDFAFAVGNCAVVRLEEKWGMVLYDEVPQYRFELNGGDPIGFRHRTYDTKIRLDLPTMMDASKCHFDFVDALGCSIDKVSWNSINTEYGNRVEYDCKLVIPENLPDAQVEVSYPIQISYDKLIYPIDSLEVYAWRYAYLNPYIDKSETFVKEGRASFTVTISKDQNYDADYPFEVAVQTLEEDTLSCTVSKHSETVYKCEIYPLKKGVNHINVCILEDGCPPSVFPFEITYIPPVLVEEKGEVRVVEEEKVEFVKKELPRKKGNAKRNIKPQIPMTDFLQ